MRCIPILSKQLESELTKALPRDYLQKLGKKASCRSVQARARRNRLWVSLVSEGGYLRTRNAQRAGFAKRNRLCRNRSVNKHQAAVRLDGCVSASLWNSYPL